MTYLYMGDTVTAAHLMSETTVPPIDEKTIGIEQAIHELAAGTIFYYQHRYVEARTSLSKLEAATGHSREQLRAWIRLAACVLAQGQTSEVIHYLDAIATAVASVDGYEQMVFSELRHLPALENIIKTLPEAARLRALLHLDSTAQEITNPTQPVLLLPSVPSASPKPDRISSIVQQGRLRILALGEPTVLLDEKPMTHWRMARAMELVFYLLDCSRPMRKEQMLTALWPEVDEQTDHTLHSTIY